MLTHKQIWTAIDSLAARYGMSPSGLARKSGLDATTFNPSKRIAADGKKRWPSTESVSKVLTATGASLEELVSLILPKSKMAANVARPIPLLGLAQAGAHGYFDDSGFPAGSGWDHVKLPTIEDDSAFALQVTGESMLPLYREGDIIVLSPNAPVRKGDRVVVKTTNGEVMAKVLNKKGKKVELHSINPAYPPRTIEAHEIDWMTRIIWAKQ